jgi:hypothetical protein
VPLILVQVALTGYFAKNTLESSHDKNKASHIPLGMTACISYHYTHFTPLIFHGRSRF